MQMKTKQGPTIDAGLESLIALSFASGMFALAVLRPVLGAWLPL
jgi:hypothetical protein